MIEIPYNFDGLSYQRHAPSAPEAATLAWKGGRFVTLAPAPRPSMDHRGLAVCQGGLFTVGGMVDGPRVVADVRRLELRAMTHSLGGKVLMPAMEIAKVGRFSVVHNPSGAVFSPFRSARV